MPKIIEFEGKEIEVPDDATDEEVAGILEQYAPEDPQVRAERSVGELREQGAMGFGPQEPVPAYDKKPGDFPRAPLPVEMRTPEERYAERYQRAAALYMETAGEGGQRDSDKAAGEFHRIFPPGTPTERLESFIAAQESARETMAREGGTAARIVRPLIALSEGVLAENFTDSTRLGAGGRAAIEKSRAEDGALMRIAEGTARGLGSAATLMGTPGAGIPAQLGKAALYGAAADTEDPVRGAVTMPAMLAAGGLGVRALAGANPSAMRSLVAGAVTGPPAGIAARALSGQDTTLENVAEDAALEAIFAAVNLPGALRRRPALPVAEAGRAKQEAVDRGLARPEEAFSERAAADAMDAIEAGRSPVDALEARQPLPAKGGGTDAGYKPTERAIADGDVAPEAIPLVRAVEAKGADAVASGVTDGEPYVIARGPNGEAIVERGAPEAAPAEPAPKAADPAERAASEALDALTGRAGGEPTGIKNAVVNAERAARGVEPLPDAPVEHHPEVVARARASIVDNPNRARELVKEITEKPRNLETVEEAVLDIHRVDTKRAFERADKEGREAAARGDANGVAEAQARRTQASEDFAAMEEATKAAGREWGRAGSFRKRLMADDYSLVKMESDRSAANDYRPLPPEQAAKQAAETKRLHDEIAKAVADRDAYHARIIEIESKRALGRARTGPRGRPGTPEYGATNAVVTRATYDAAKAAMRSRLTQLSAGIDPTMLKDLAVIGAFHIEAGARGFARWARAMTADLGEKVRPHLQDVWEASQERLREAGTKTPDERALQSIKTRTRTRTTDLEERVAAGDLEIPQRRPVHKDPEAIRLEARLEQAKQRWNEALFRDRLSHRTKAQKAAAGVLETTALARAVMTGMDVSAVLRQNIFATLSHPVRAFRNLGPMFKSFASREAQTRSEAELRMRPTYVRNKRAGLHQSDIGTTTLSQMEEAYMTRWLQPRAMKEGQPVRNALRGAYNVATFPFAGAARAFTTFSNRMRMDAMDAMVAGFKHGVEPTTSELRSIAHAANVFTGRGGPAGAKNALAGLNYVLFSPRLLASRVQILLGTPLYGGSMRTRGIVAKEYARFLTGVAVLYGLAKMAGGEVEDDVRSADFGKARFGDTRIDALGGMQQVTVLAGRVAHGEQVDSRGKVHDAGFDTLARFARTKLAPIPGAAINARFGKNLQGEKATVVSEAAGLVTPMSLKDIYDAMVAQGVPKGTAMGILNLFGAGLQTYEARKRGR